MSILHHSVFFTTVNHIKDLPRTNHPEIAFAGRSNAGKSSAINVLCNQKRLAFSSNTPGRTQHINYFTVGRRGETFGYLVDLPGYGYAKTPLAVKAHWNELLGIYVEQREQLKGLVLMVDIRRGLTDLDLEMVNWFTPLAKPIHVLLTKSDKLTKSLCNQALFAVRKTLTEIAGPWATVQLFSSTNRVGLEEAGERIGGWILEHKIDSTPEDA
jgi:GTP-binding protein